MARIELSAQFIGDDAGRRTSVEATVTEMAPLAASGSTGDETTLRVRATGLSAADLARITGTGWTDSVVIDGDRTVAGKISKLELQDGGEIEFLIAPGR